MLQMKHPSVKVNFHLAVEKRGNYLQKLQIDSFLNFLG